MIEAIMLDKWLLFDKNYAFFSTKTDVKKEQGNKVNLNLVYFLIIISYTPTQSVLSCLSSDNYIQSSYNLRAFIKVKCDVY